MKRSRINSLNILCYHGVTEGNHDGVQNFSGKHILVNQFREQMEIVKRYTQILTINEVVWHMQNEEPWGDKSVVVSFDDGFKNNYQFAAPILEELDIPAVFYVCSGMIGTEMMFWVDIIEDCINRTKVNEFDIKLDVTHSFNISSREQKIQAIVTIKDFCKRVTSVVRDQVIDELIEKTQIVPSVNSSNDYRMMNWQELRDLSSNPLFTIGGHTMYHDIMTSRPINIVEEDIINCLGLLKNHLNLNISHFSYPEGQDQHYNHEVIAALKRNGIVCCPSAREGTNYFPDDLFHLKRNLVGFMGNSLPRF